MLKFHGADNYNASLLCKFFSNDIAISFVPQHVLQLNEH